MNQSLSRAEKQPTKREWLLALLEGMERSHFTGTLQVTLHFNRGGITRLIPLKEVSIEEEIRQLLG